MATEMEVTAVTPKGIAPVLSTKSFLPDPVLAELDEDDLYTRQKLLQRQLEFVDIQEEYIKDEQKNLKRELLRAQEEVKRIQSVPLVIGQFIEMVDQNNGIVGSTTGSNYYVRILSTINRELLKPSSSVALHRHSNALVDVLPPEADSSISLLTQSEKPDVSYNDIGGCDIQKQEIREAVELPLTHHELYKQIGIDPPRGVLLYGPPGTGKTMLAKAVAHHTTAAFIRVVGSEFVQKYLGEVGLFFCLSYCIFTRCYDASDSLQIVIYRSLLYPWVINSYFTFIAHLYSCVLLCAKFTCVY
ncbi:hypothetical protein KC19_2G208800 [Ceratodon purpureus]|uniref:Uncharacterized protein n=1 Tax=Ceratodon purpureus TaxID=3225 RepID=A0A8T0IXU1_CERPU|nr:hypothetical protein KC19_2G208800 [Ceratodon purpureus]